MALKQMPSELVSSELITLYDMADPGSAPLVKPNELAGARLVTGGPMVGELEAFARRKLCVDEFVDFCGTTVKRGEGKAGNEIALGQKQDFDPSICCAATYVNDSFGPGRVGMGAEKIKQLRVS